MDFASIVFVGGAVIVLVVLALIGAGVIVWVAISWLYPYKFSGRPIFGDITVSENPEDLNKPIEQKVKIGQGGITFGKRKTVKMGPYKTGSLWKVLWSTKRIPPMPIAAILPGRQIDGYILPGGHYIPASHDIAKQMDKIVAHMTAIMPEAKSHAINALEAYARKFDPRTQSDKVKMVLAWIVAGLVVVGMVGTGCYFTWKIVSYGMDKGTENAAKGQEVSTQMAATIAQTVCGIAKNETVAGVARPNLPFPVTAIGSALGGIPQ